MTKSDSMVVNTERRKLLWRAAALPAFSLVGAAAHAAAFPSKPVRIVVPYAPGGPADAFARIVAPKLDAVWGAPVVVENRAGATGIIGTSVVAQAPADGHTLLVGSGSTAISATLDENLPYDPLRDLVPVVGLASTPYFLFASPALPADSIGELVQLARSRPSQIAYSSAGPGGTPHLAGEMFDLLAQTQLLHVPYKGTGPATNALVAGEVQLMFGSLTSTHQFVEAGRLKILGSADAKRSSLRPEIPTIAEQGVPGFAAENWFGLFAPAGTPGDVVEIVADAVNGAMAGADVATQLQVLGATPMRMTGAEFAAYFQDQVDLWARVIRERGLKKK